MQILCFDPKIKNNLKNFYNPNITSQRIESTTVKSLSGRWHHCATGVLSTWHFFEILLFIQVTDYRLNFAKTILFENCSKIPFSISVESPRIFQCLILIPAGHWVRQIDGDLRRFFLSALLSLVISMIRTIRKSAARWRGRRVQDYRKSILRANLLYVPNIKM